MLPSNWLAYVNKPKAPVTSDQQCEQKSWVSGWEWWRTLESEVEIVDPWDFLFATSAWITHFIVQSTSWESDVFTILLCDSVLCQINQSNFSQSISLKFIFMRSSHPRLVSKIIFSFQIFYLKFCKHFSFLHSPYISHPSRFIKLQLQNVSRCVLSEL